MPGIVVLIPSAVHHPRDGMLPAGRRGNGAPWCVTTPTTTNPPYSGTMCAQMLAYITILILPAVFMIHYVPLIFSLPDSGKTCLRRWPSSLPMVIACFGLGFAFQGLVTEREVGVRMLGDNLRGVPLPAGHDMAALRHGSGVEGAERHLPLDMGSGGIHQDEQQRVEPGSGEPRVPDALDSRRRMVGRRLGCAAHGGAPGDAPSAGTQHHHLQPSDAERATSAGRRYRTTEPTTDNEIRKKNFTFGQRGVTAEAARRFLPLSLRCRCALYLISDGLAPLAGKVLRYRRRVVRENLRPPFPEMTEKERRKIRA